MDKEVMALTHDVTAQEVDNHRPEPFVIDSGSEVHAVPRGLVRGRPGCRQGGRLHLRGAGAEELQHHGSIVVRLGVEEDELEIPCEVADIRRALLSVARLEDRGFCVSFEAKSMGMRKGPLHLPFQRKGSLYLFRGRFLGTCGKDDLSSTEQVVMPVEEEHEEQAPMQEEQPAQQKKD